MAKETKETARKQKRETAAKHECKLCQEQAVLDYKQADLLKRFMTERGKILPRRLTGNCAKHQRALATAIKRARIMLLVR
ncbi:MAG: 30S ribosomal protein S18 [Verrucomicrobiae bacterium]|nr:30S ribosomal protein S18 [Verrucomicrobiae bacterium]